MYNKMYNNTPYLYGLCLAFIIVMVNADTNRCDIPPSAPRRIEEVINKCQDEIKVAILSEALDALNVNEHTHSRAKRAAFTDDEKRIAGCLLQCVYRKMDATNRCDIPPSAPRRIEEVINKCQDEIKVAILSEALDALNVNEHTHSRAKRAAFTDDEKRIAGCLLQCVYRKMDAVNEKGFPTVDGLVALYTDGISQKDYILATMQAVNHCIYHAQKIHLISPQSIEEHGKTCDIAYDVFDCVSEEIGKYCGQTP